MEALASADRVRRLTGCWLDAIGLGPRETPSRLVHARDGFDLLGYGGPGESGPAVLLVPAPIKRAYIWDLAPTASVVRRCLERGLRVHLVRWTETEQDLGLADYADRLVLEAARATGAETGEHRIVLVGHSLGGTLAGLFAAAHPERVRGLVLLEAPLRFSRAGAGALAAAVGAAPERVIRPGARTVPGTWLALGAILAAPDVFVWDRWLDRIASGGDPERLLLHARVERWMLDELPLPGRLVEDVVRLLYREDRFMEGTLTLGGRAVRPGHVTAPILAVVDPRSRLVPEAAVRPFLDAAATRDTTLLTYGGDRGVSLQHLGVLVGHTAHQRLWPSILDWIARHA